MSKYTKLPKTDPDWAGEDAQQFDVDVNDDIIIQPDLLRENAAPAPAQDQQQLSGAAPVFVPSNLIGGPKKVYEGGYLSLNYYRQYFDLDSEEFFRNCIQSLNPLSELNPDTFQSNGDLYGPVWITAGLVVLLFFCNSMAEMIGSTLNSGSGTNVNYFKLLVSSINLMYGYTFLVPLAVYLGMWLYFKVDPLIPLTRIIAIYSYGNLMWLPAALLSIFRGILINHHILGSILKWVCVLIGGVLSGFSICFKLKQYLDLVFDPAEDKRGLYVLVALLVCHVGYTIGIEVCYFGSL